MSEEKEIIKVFKTLTAELKGLREDTKAVKNEIRSLREDTRAVKVDTCEPDEALMILGLKNRGYLYYFAKKGLLTRRKGASYYVYFKSECAALAEKIKNNEIEIPQTRYLYGK